MFRQFLALALLVTLDSALAQSPTHDAPDKSCREHPQVIGKCFTIRGRLSLYNGAPALRLWRVGTRRLLGVSAQRFALPGYRNIPADVETQATDDTAVFGDFTVCPFTPPRRGEMQLVCIESGKNLLVRKRQ
jgi:hypothetical protein